MRLSIIIPAYKGDDSLAHLYEKILDFFSNHQEYSYEVIFVFDSGNETTWQVIKEIKSKYPKHVKGIRLSRNFGQHNALICGIKHANSDFLITMDEDLQHDPSDIIKLINKQKEGNYDLVYANLVRLKHSFYRNLTSRILKGLIRLSIPGLPSEYSAYRLIKTNLAKETLSMNNSYTFLDGYLSWITLYSSSIDIQHYKRPIGKSSYSLRKLINHALNIFFTFSNAPIRLLTYISVIIFTFSTIYAIYLIIRKLIYDDLISGYASTMIILGFGIGIIVFGMGIIGEYLYRINLKTTKRPNYIETEII
ncbi:MAG: glycosyltransferase family 2 protein [Bacteroidales bacterium]|nr:glycosyltransferase family 2 protein [Bacteroidales bacterium]